jgi:hypothetical protein
MKKLSQWLIPAAFLLCLTSSASAQRVFFEDFESGGPDWITSNGIWEFGTPTAGPSAAHSGFQCAGTILGGDYFAYDDSRLEFPRPSGTAIQLPAVNGDEELRLRYWASYSYSSYDIGYSEVSYWDTVNSTWSAWETIPGAKTLTEGHAWHLKDVDLTAYAGKEIKIGFFHTANRSNGHFSESTGWYLDDVEIVKVQPLFSGDFESGEDFWTVEDGLWEFGAPTTGPNSGYLSDDCVGTSLHGNYQAYKDSRLISPSVILPTVSGSETLWVGYRQWWSYSSYDSGYVQVSEQDSNTLEWSAWTTLANSTVSGTGSIWTLRELELTAFAGKKVRVAFHHTANRSNGHSSEGSGWFIDDVYITGTATPPRLPELSVKVNGLDADINLLTTETARITLELESGDYGGSSVELWVGAATARGDFWYHPLTNTWSPSRIVYSQGPLVDMPETEIYNADLPVGTYTIFFVLDRHPNGLVDVDMYNTANIDVL